MRNVRILQVSYRNLPLFQDGTFAFNFMAMDRVADKEQVFQIKDSIYTQKLESIIGINASGKTSSLKLLYLAMSVILRNTSLNDQSLLGRELLRDDTEMVVTFLCDDTCWQLHSIIGVDDSNDGIKNLYYKEEYLYSKPWKIIRSKREPLHFTDKELEQYPPKQRSKMSKETLSMIPQDTSISLSVTRESSTTISQMIVFTNINFPIMEGNPNPAILHAFDPTLDEFNTKSTDDGFSYTVRFKNDSKSKKISSPFSLENIISSGTIKGRNLIYLIQRTLMTGGYLIVDELENHMNKELIRMITDIFKDPAINPHGACLIFSTHYAEVLDFIDRKDSIYITRRKDDGIELANYSQLVNRNDVKKSEVILSNIIKGTAPLYENMRALEDYLCKTVK